MTNMKNIGYLFLAGTIALSLSSCVSLDEEPSSSLVAENFYTKEADAISAVNAVYETLHYDAGQSLYNGLIQIGVEMATDDYEAGPRARNSHVRAISNLTHDVSNNRMEELWLESYKAINRANIAIDKISAISPNNISADVQKRLVNEAKFLRALHYFNLIRWFKYIPLVLHETTTLSTESLNIKQATEDEVYEQIISDLKDAEQLPAPDGYSSSDVGRATAGSAKALLSKVYLTRQQWQLAADKAKEVIDTGWYDLFDNFADAFNPATKNGKEHIFSVQYQGYSNYVGNYLAVRSATNEVPGISGENADAYHQESDLYGSFEPTDVRRDISFVTDIVSPVDGKNYHLRVPLLNKYHDENANSNPKESSVNFPYFRYSEILLIYAEALNELNGPTAEAYNAVDKVRSRAGSSKLADVAPALSQDNFRDSVFQERRKEFIYEHQRWFDLSRRGAEYYVKMLKAAGKTQAQPKHIHFPVPQREIDLNPNLKQNPDWE